MEGFNEDDADDSEFGELDLIHIYGTRCRDYPVRHECPIGVIPLRIRYIDFVRDIMLDL
jgi:hypothetical protein